ncbi:MAG: sulfotransferase family protein [Marinibacterium sp.]|nr:sulfotransferase family protein [Marinibacterium sp.]
MDREGKIIDLKATRDSIRAEPRKVLLFCHMHKTGGTTIEKMLVENFSETAYRVSTPNELDEFKQKVEAGLLDEEKTYLVFGHRAHLTIDFLKDRIPSFPFTIFRRPLSLFESNYSFQHTRQGNTSLTTEEYLEQYPKNRIIDFLGAKDFETAVANAHRDYLVVGITERLAETAAILSYLFDLPAKPYQSRNVTNPGNYVEMDFECVLDYLRDNEDDRLIYDYFDAVHVRSNRQFSTLEDAQSVALETGAGTFNRPIQINEDLDENNDKFSLLITGQSIWEKDKARAFEFFDKSFSKDWMMEGRIMRFLQSVDNGAAVEWAKGRLAELGDAETDMAKKVRARLQKAVK